MTAPAVVETEVAWLDSERCSRRRWDGTRLCSMQGTLLLTGMCVHEHLMESRYCQHHADEMTSGTLQLACVKCRLGDRPHNCLVSVVAAVGATAEAWR